MDMVFRFLGDHDFRGIVQAWLRMNRPTAMIVGDNIRLTLQQYKVWGGTCACACINTNNTCMCGCTHVIIQPQNPGTLSKTSNLARQTLLMGAVDGKEVFGTSDVMDISRFFLIQRPWPSCSVGLYIGMHNSPTQLTFFPGSTPRLGRPKTSSRSAKR